MQYLQQWILLVSRRLRDCLSKHESNHSESNLQWLQWGMCDMFRQSWKLRDLHTLLFQILLYLREVLPVDLLFQCDDLHVLEWIVQQNSLLPSPHHLSDYNRCGHHIQGVLERHVFSYCCHITLGLDRNYHFGLLAITDHPNLSGSRSKLRLSTSFNCHFVDIHSSHQHCTLQGKLFATGIGLICAKMAKY